MSTNGGLSLYGSIVKIVLKSSDKTLCTDISKSFWLEVTPWLKLGA